MSAFDASRSNSRDIKDVKAIRSKRHSRGGDASGSGDTLLYIINFEDNQGFALVGADERTEPIFAIVDEGNYAIRTDTIPSDSCEHTNPGWNDFVEGAEAIAEWDVWYCEGLFVTSKGWNILNKRSPMLITRWGQGDFFEYYYGKYCPNKLTGCVITAAAQILSLYRHIRSVEWHDNTMWAYCPLNWDRIMSDTKQNGGVLGLYSTPESLDEIAHLCRYLGIALDADYKKDATSAKSSKLVDWFNNWSGILKATKMAAYNEDRIIEAIRDSNPVYACGKSNQNSSGHAWVYDGYVIASRNNEEKKFLHCNWGWDGRNNGYYLSRVFNTNNGPEIEDYEVNETYDSEQYNYQYNLEYSIISYR